MSATDAILIVDYGAGNLASIQNMLKKVGHRSILSSDADEIRAARRIILPGVGAFDHGMKGLRERGLLDVLNHQVLEEKVPVLGICLGMQLLSGGSEEGESTGLGWIPARTVRFTVDSPAGDEPPLRVPHMGWADTTPTRPGGLFEGLEEEARFYFVHSYHVVPEEESAVLARAHHGHEFVAAVEHENVRGVQFHPEKSHRFGMKLLENFAALP